MSDLKISIRRAEPNDAAGCCELMRNEDVFAGLLQLPYPTETAWRERLSSKSNEGDILLVAVYNSEVIGQISLFGNTQMRRRHAAMFGLAVIGHAQGKGVGSALLKAMIDYADSWTTFLRIELTVYADNAKAIALYKKFGFEQEGVLRNYSLRNGRFEDVLTMARFNPNQALPSVLALHVGRRMLERLSPISILVISEAVGALGVLVPFTALRFESVSLLVASSFLPAISIGIGVPAYSLLLKRGFVDKDFATVSAIESISLSSHIILGVGVGTLLFPFLARDVYLGVDLLTYVVSIGLLIASKGSTPVNVNAVDTHMPISNAQEARKSVRPVVYWSIPVVAALISPAMALLPAAGDHFSSVTLIGMSLNASLVLLLARGASQLIGPALIKHRTVDELYKNKWAMATYFAGFFTLYSIALASASLLVACLCVLIAHILAYALSATVQTALFKKFPERDLVAVSSRTYQVQIISASLPGLLAGLTAESTGILLSYLGLTLVVVAVCVGVCVAQSNRANEEK